MGKCTRISNEVLLPCVRYSWEERDGVGIELNVHERVAHTIPYLYGVEFICLSLLLHVGSKWDLGLSTVLTSSSLEINNNMYQAHSLHSENGLEGDGVICNV